MKKKHLHYSKRQRVEEPLENVEFVVHKFNNRPKPDKNKTLIVCCFSEFGCETISCLYCLPKILQKTAGFYTIAVGWYGRAYLYKHLVDEFWELKEDYQHLRDNTFAFKYVGKNLAKIENQMSNHGKVIPTGYMGNLLVGNYCGNPECRDVRQGWESIEKCPKCGEVEKYYRSIFGDHQHNKKFAVRLPHPSKEKLDWARKLVGEKAVAIFARGRKTYGRNLPSSFYVDLIKLLEDKGYSPVWLGEKQSTQPCPVDHILDFSRNPESRDLESTLAIVCNCEFTVQFWTASTRLAGMMGIPWLLFETPDQIYAKQEGIRQEMSTFGEKKLCLCDFNNVYNNPKEAIDLTKRCIEEMQIGNFDDVVGLIDNKEALANLIEGDFYNLRRK